MLKMRAVVTVLLSVLCAVLLQSGSCAILPFNDDAINEIFKKKSSALIFFLDDSKESEDAKKALQEVDATSPDYVLAVSSANDGHGLYERLAEYLGLNLNLIPQAIFFANASQKYKYDQDVITSKQLLEFTTRVNAGEVEQFLKSAEIPEPDGHSVRVLVGKNFKQEVLESEKEILVKFYAPWCGHCKSLAPHFEQAAKSLAGNPNIMLAKVDSTENEVAGIEIEGYPTLKFWGKDKSVPPIDYDGGRDADGIIEWLKTHSDYPWVEPVQVAEDIAEEEEKAEQPEEQL